MRLRLRWRLRLQMRLRLRLRFCGCGCCGCGGGYGYIERRSEHALTTFEALLISLVSCGARVLTRFHPDCDWCALATLNRP